MQVKFILLTVCAFMFTADLGWSCNQTTYAGCSPEQLRAIQQQQFNDRKRQSVSSDEYWRDRQYLDRLRLEERNHELELEKLRSETAIEVARQERRSWRRGGYYFYRQPVVVHPRPLPPVVVKPTPLPGDISSSKPSFRMVPKAVK